MTTPSRNENQEGNRIREDNGKGVKGKRRKREGRVGEGEGREGEMRG